MKPEFTIYIMHNKNYFFLIICLLGSFFASSQTAVAVEKHKGNKGKFFLFWGYNRGYYTNSDLHLYGDNYDFTLHKLVAHDRQTPFSADVYFDPAKLTIPQCNYGVGYYINDHYSISLTADHMKYVMVQDQTAKISGTIAQTNTPYNGSYDHEDIVVKGDLLVFEHTDGLNYIVTEFNRTDNILPKFTHYSGRRFELNLKEGIGLGALVPRTNATLLSNPRNDEFHFAGYGASVRVGVNAIFFRHLMLEINLKGGFIHMPDIRTTQSPRDHARQKFGFFQDNVLLGWRF